MARAPRVLTMIMAGGRGERLFPLTRERSKPSVPFGGRYRIVDFVISNLVNSGFFSMYVLVQYRSQSLIEHLRMAWRTTGILPRRSGRASFFQRKSSLPSAKRFTSASCPGSSSFPR